MRIDQIIQTIVAAICVAMLVWMLQGCRTPQPIVQTEVKELDAIDTENVERMVYVMPMTNIIREDIAKKLFTRDQLQEQAPEAMDGYWQVPRLVD